VKKDRWGRRSTKSKQCEEEEEEVEEGKGK